MTGIPNIGMQTGADLIVDVEGVEVLVRAQIQDAQISPRDEPDQVMGLVVGGNDEAARSVPLSERADECGAAVAGAKAARFRVESIPGFGKAAPVPIGRARGVQSPDLGARGHRTPAKPTRSSFRKDAQVARGKLRHRGTRASAMPCRRSLDRPVLLRSTSRRGRRASCA